MKRSNLLLILISSAIILGLIHLITRPDPLNKYFRYNPPEWTKEHEKKIEKLLSDYGIKREWIKYSKTQIGVIEKPEVNITTPPDLPFSDFTVNLNRAFADENFTFIGFDHRRERIVSLHAYDGRSVFATLNLKVSDKVKRNNQRIYLLIDNWTGEESDGSDNILKREITATPMIILDDVKKVQEISSSLIKAKVDFGIRLLDQGSTLSYHKTSPQKIKEGNQAKISMIFPSASFYLNSFDDAQKANQKAGVKFINPSELYFQKSITSVKTLSEKIVSEGSKRNFRILKIDASLLKDENLTTLITDLQRKGFSFRYFRDFRSDLKNDQ